MNYTLKNNRLFWHIIAISLIFIFTSFWARNPRLESFSFLACLLLFWFILSVKYPAFGFMVALFMYLNVGNYLTPNTLGLPDFFQIRDIALIMLFVTVFFGRIRDKSFWRDYNFRNLLMFASLFAFYQIFICILFHLNPAPYEFLRQIAGHRWRIFGIFVAIPTYIIIRHNAKSVFNFIILSSFIILSLYFITILTPLNLIKTWSFERAFGYEAMRITFYNYGYMQMVVLMALSALILKYNYKYKKILFISAILMVIAQLLTLSRLMNFNMLTSILLLTIIIKKFTKISFTKNIKYIFAFSLIVLALIALLSPQLLKSTYINYHATFLQLKGKMPGGTSEVRLMQLPEIMPLIKDNPIIGVGYEDYMWEKSDVGGHVLADIPFLANLAIYGIVGLFMFLIIYIIEFKRIRDFYLLSKNNPIQKNNKLSKIQLIFLLVIIAYFFNNFFRLIYLTSELVYKEGMVFLGFNLGILFGLVRFYEEIFYNKYK